VVQCSINLILFNQTFSIGGPVAGTPTAGANNPVATDGEIINIPEQLRLSSQHFIIFVTY